MFGMAALIPIIHEILPMIMPSSISVTKADEIFPPTGTGSLPTSLSLDPDTTTGVQQNGNLNGEKKTPSGNVNGNGNRIRVISRDAVVNKSDKMCASVLIIPPNSSSTIRHNGEQDAIIYAASGSGTLLSSPKDDEEPELVTMKVPVPTNSNTNPQANEKEEQQKQEEEEEEEIIIQEPQPVRYPLSKGDFAFVPAWTEHQALNESLTEDVIWVVIRSGSTPVEVNLTDWGGAEAKGGR